MVHNTLSPQHPADASGAALRAAAERLDLSQGVLEEMDRYPESAGEILLEEAAGPDPAGGAEKAVSVLDALIEYGPDTEYRQFAAMEKLRFQFAEEGGQTRDGAEHVIADLLVPGVLQKAPAGLLAEMLAAQGRLEQALTCYDIASQKYLAGNAKDLDEEDLVFAYALIGRARVRADLGYAPDDFDRRVHNRADPAEMMDRLTRAVGLSQNEPQPSLPAELGGADGPPPAAPGPPPVSRPGRQRGHQVLCSREDFHLARERAVLTGEYVDQGADAYFRAGEQVLREKSREYPGVDWRLALFSLAEMEEYARSRGGEPSDRQLRGEWGESLAHDDPRLRPWPPERNKPCWCASGRKYKKCCGSPSLR
ncbi:SEC-C domain-containing protein [Nocardiopsis oceani]